MVFGSETSEMSGGCSRDVDGITGCCEAGVTATGGSGGVKITGVTRSCVESGWVTAAAWDTGSARGSVTSVEGPSAPAVLRAVENSFEVSVYMLKWISGWVLK